MNTSKVTLFIASPLWFAIVFDEITEVVYQNSDNYASQGVVNAIYRLDLGDDQLLQRIGVCWHIVSLQNQLKLDLISKRNPIHANQGDLWLQPSRLLKRVTVHRHEREAPLLIET
jgi:hypothetical protein